MGRIYDIMCDDITCEDLYLVSLAGMEDITYDDINPKCVRLWDGLTICCLTI